MPVDVGVKTPDLPAGPVDELLGNRIVGGVRDTLRVPIATLAAQLLAEPSFTSIATGYDVTYATRGELYADLAWVAGKIGRVTGDATLAYRGIYKKSGASGAGAWTKIGDLLTGEVTSVAGKSGAVTLVKADVGLSNADNTTDLLKPISTATQTALNLKATQVDMDAAELELIQQYMRLVEEENRTEGNPYQGVEADFPFYIADEEGRVSLGVRDDGSLRLDGADWQFEDMTPEELLGTPEPNLAFWVRDELGRVGWGIRLDGTIVGPTGTSQTIAFDPDDAGPIAYTKTYLTKSAVYTIDGQGTDTLLVGDGTFDAYDPIVFKNSYVKYRSDRDGEMSMWRVSLDGQTHIRSWDGVIYHYPWRGQSNSGPSGLGGAFFGTIAGFDPVDEFTALMFVGGAAVTFPGDYNDWNSAEEVAGPIPAGNLDRFVPLANQAALDMEGHWMGFADQVRTSADPFVNLHSWHGCGGFNYAAQKKGTQLHTNMVDSVKESVDKAAWIGMRVVVPGVPVQHGEGDFGNAAYGANLGEWTTDINADLIPLTGQSQPIKLWMTQPNNWAYAIGAGDDMPVSPKIILAEHEAGNIVLVTPTYHVLHDLGNPEQWIHISAYGRRLIGEKYGQAMAIGPDGYLLHPDWSPLRPSAIVATGSNIVLSFAGRQGALQFNEWHATTNPNGVVDPGNKGFRLTNAAMVPLAGITISSVTRINSNTQIQIACSTTVPAGAYLGYADHAVRPVQSGPIDGPRGVVSDSDTLVPSVITQAYRKDILGQSDAAKVAPLVNWLVAFSKPVTIA